MSETDKTASPGAESASAHRFARSLYPIFALLGALAIWQFIVVVFQPAPYLLPTPHAVGSAIVTHFSMLIYHTGITTMETLLAFVLSIAIGLPLAAMIARYRWFEDTVYPLLVVSQAIPKVALAPLILVWLGFGLPMKIVIGVLVAFFPVVISGVVGLKSVPNDMILLGRSMGLSQADMFRKIYLPSALPSIFGGLKVSITMAVVGAVVGEFVGADRGLGYLILLTSGQLQTPVMFAALFFLSLLGVVSFAIVQWAEKRLMPWHKSIRRDEH